MQPLNDRKTVVTLGEGDHSLCIWSVNVKPVMEQFRSGGTGLQPYCSLILGGNTGWLFKEMQDIFIYLQMFHDAKATIRKQVITDNVSMLMVGHFMRAIGFFASEFEINAMLRELTQNQPEYAAKRTVSFEELVKLYINYRPPKVSFPIDSIENAFMRCAYTGMNVSDEFIMRKFPNKDDVLLERSDLMNVLSTNGQPMSRLETTECLNILLTNDDDDADVDDTNVGDREREKSLLANTPEVFSLNDFMGKLLGLEVATDGTYKYMSCVDPSQINSDLINKTTQNKDAIFSLL